MGKNQPKSPRPTRPVIVRYEDANGKRCRKSDPGAVAVHERSSTYYAQIPGQGRVSLETTDEATAWVILNQKLREAREREAGILTPAIESARVTLAELVDEYHEILLASGISQLQARLVRDRVKTIAEAAQWSRVGDITADSAKLALAGLVKSRPGRGGGKGAPLSPQTRNHYRSALRQFCYWLVEKELLPKYPLDTVDEVSVATDRRHDRRVPTDQEVEKLFTYLHSPTAPDRLGMSGPRRALGYRLAMCSGLRANELRHLTVASFDLNKGTVTRLGKNKKSQEIPLPQWLVSQLRDWFSVGGGLWERFPEIHPGRLLIADLAGAGVEYEADGPHGKLYFDMHSLRHWYATALASDPENDIKTVMDLLGHSTPTLTLKVYAKARDNRKRAAVDRLRSPSPPSSQTHPPVPPQP